MLLEVAQFIFSAAIVVVAGTLLTKAADRIAEITGWGRLFVGGLFLAAGTSLPELVVDIKAIQVGLPDLAVGDLLGSSLFNILVLAILDFTFPSKFKGTAFSPQNIHHSLSVALAVLLTSIVGVGIVSGLNRQFLEIGFISWILVGTYLFGIRLIYLEGSNESNDNSQEGASLKPILNAAAMYLAGVALILWAAPLLVEAADKIAVRTDLGHTFIGTTAVALATSLPELVSTIVSFRIGRPDLAIGNIFGSNAFNMVLFVPLDYFYVGSLFASVKSVHAVSAFSVIAVMGVALMGQLYRKKRGSRFTEPSSEIIVAIIFVFLFLLYTLNSK